MHEDFKQVSNLIKSATHKAYFGRGAEGGKSGNRGVRREARKERWVTQNLGSGGNDEKQKKKKKKQTEEQEMASECS